MARKTEPSLERERARTAEFRRRFESWRKAQADAAWKMRGWKAKAASATGLDPSVISRITTGARPVNMDHIAEFVAALKAPELLPADVPAGVGATLRQDRALRPRSDPAGTVPDDRLVPRDLVEYLAAKGEEDAVRVWELIDILGMQNLEATGAKRSTEFYRGMLLAVRSAGPGSRAR